MKKLSKLLALLMFLFSSSVFVSCGDDKDSISDDLEGIDGNAGDYIIDGYVLAWGKSMNFVKSLEKRDFVEQIDESVLVYKGVPAKYELSVEYMFILDELASVQSILHNAPLEDVKKYISEKYDLVKYDKENKTWIYSDNKLDMWVSITYTDDAPIIGLSYFWKKLGDIVPPIPDLDESLLKR